VIRRAFGAVLAAACVLALAVTPLHAAAAEPPLEFWLDRPLPEDVAEGIEIPIGLMVWDVQAQQLISDNPPFVRLNPAEGDAEPSMVTLVEDWNGHYGGSLPVPQGGLGTFEIGYLRNRVRRDGLRRDQLPA
jgi:hypothetical protein